MGFRILSFDSFRIRNPLLNPLSYGGVQTGCKKPKCIHKKGVSIYVKPGIM